MHAHTCTHTHARTHLHSNVTGAHAYVHAHPRSYTCANVMQCPAVVAVRNACFEAPATAEMEAGDHNARDAARSDTTESLVLSLPFTMPAALDFVEWLNIVSCFLSISSST